MYGHTAVSRRHQRRDLRIDSESRSPAGDSPEPRHSTQARRNRQQGTGERPETFATSTQPRYKRTCAGCSGIRKPAQWRLRRKGRRSPAKLWIALSILLAMLLIGWSVTSEHASQSNRLTEKDTVVLTDFANSTGDAVFDDTLKTALNVSLRQSPFLSVLPDQQVAETLQRMTRPAATELTPDVTREICLRAKSKAYIAGAIGSLGNEYVLGLKAVNCQNGTFWRSSRSLRPPRRRCLDRTGCGGLKATQRTRRIAGLGAKIRRAARRSHDPFTRSAESLHRGMEGSLLNGCFRGRTFLQARD